MVTEEQKIQSRNSDERIRTEINTYNKYQIEVTNTSNESKIKHVKDRDCLTGHTLRYTDTDHSEVGVEKYWRNSDERIRTEVIPRRASEIF